MSFKDRFNFPTPVPNRPADGPDLALSGQEAASGRAITLHLLSAAALDNTRILKQIEGLAPLERVHVLETGAWNGAPYVVTDALPGGQTLRRWMKSLADDEMDKLGRAGKFRIPPGVLPAQPGEFTGFMKAQPPAGPDPADLPTQVLAVSPALLPQDAPTEVLRTPPAPPPPTPPPADEPGEFTRMFQAQAPERAPAPPTPPPQPPKPPPAAEAGEFTRMFQAQAHAPERVPAPPPPPPPAPAPPTAEPGEFTRMFQAQAQAPERAPEPPPPPAALPVAEAGEFTRMFQGKMPAAPPPPAIPPAAPPAPAAREEAGDFTRLFQRPAELGGKPVAPPPPPPPPAQQPGPANASEFTQMLKGFAMPTSPQAYVPPAPSPGHRVPKGEEGEFTRMVESPLPNLKPINPMTQAPAGKDYDPGEFTRMLEAPVDAPSRPAAKPRLQAGGDATRAFSFDEIAQPTEPAAPDAPVQSGPSEYTLLFKQPKAAPVPEEAQKPAPAPPPRRKKKSFNWVLVLILVAVLVLIAGVAAGLIWGS